MHDIDHVVNEVETLVQQEKAGQITAAELNERVGTLWQRWLSSDDRFARVLRRMLETTHAFSEGRLTDAEFRRRVQDEWLAVLEEERRRLQTAP